MKVAIYSRVFEQEQRDDISRLLQQLRDNGITPVLYSDFYAQIRGFVPFETEPELFSQPSDLSDAYDCLISLGGDGTLLDTVILVRDKNIPLLGINFGRLGFLASIGREELESAVASLVNRTYVADERTLLHLDSNTPIFGETPYALNELAIQKQDTSSMIKIHTYLNGEFLNTYWADGLIVATPTGSTGYSLSCNGPIVFPDSGSFVITPVAPHNLNVRPLIVPDNNVISFEVEGRADTFLCTLDSRKEIVPTDVQIAVKKEDFSIRLVRLNENNFLQTLRNKLSWGLDRRN
ncbi:MAG TPA: NAD kinase [Lacibacter sp.]|nr:NAD kinase [Lacibacter sp.]HMO88495.1 NAD kinase [Lacibacter sp.]HMP87039.1 NAD kinase [Lacibacter sp.]